MRVKETCPECVGDLSPVYSNFSWMENGKKRQKWVRVDGIFYCGKCRAFVKVDYGRRILFKL